MRSHTLNMNRETFELVVNWDDGENVQIECVLPESLFRPTREIKVPELGALAKMSARYQEE